MTTWRYLAQRALTGEWLDLDLPFRPDPGSPRGDLSGPGSLTGSIDADYASLRWSDGVPVLGPWATYLYAEESDEIRWGGILHRSTNQGATYQLEAAGFTSYPAGVPYTGDYRKWVGAEPGALWAALWAHLQSQPDGNLGVRLQMPVDTGAPVGTTEEPYELAWWEAQDIGSELAQIAEEGPFDYVENHYWADVRKVTTTSAAAPAASWRIGYGNLEGGYNGTDHGGWMKNRAPGQCDLIASMDVDVFAAVELHEETSTAMPKGAHRYFEGLMKARAGSDWALAEGNGGNQVLYRQSRVKVLSVVNRDGVDDPATSGSDNMRSVSDFTLQHIASGTVWHWFVPHLHADDNDGTSREDTRAAEATDLRAWVRGKAPGVISGDFNSYTLSADRPKGILAVDGWQPLQKRTTPTNTEVDSRGGAKNGRWIDDILTKAAEWDVSEAAGVPTHKLSDHALWLSVRLTRHGTTGTTTTTTTTTLATASDTGRSVGHVVQVGYPRLGRRRSDLTFRQGENVTSLIVPEMDGSDFANGALVLGKGEGKAMIRGTDAVRDGRLRRVTVYSDKTASTAARAAALAKRERGLRTLAPQLESITVQDHPHARLFSWNLGDDILVEGTIPVLGVFSDWYRIIGWGLLTETTATLSVARADSFRYGA